MPHFDCPYHITKAHLELSTYLLDIPNPKIFPTFHVSQLVRYHTSDLHFSLAVSSLGQILLWWMESKNGWLKALLMNVDAVGVCDIWSVLLINPRWKIVGSLGRSCKKMKPRTVGSPQDRQAHNDGHWCRQPFTLPPSWPFFFLPYLLFFMLLLVAFSRTGF